MTWGSVDSRNLLATPFMPLSIAEKKPSNSAKTDLKKMLMMFTASRIPKQLLILVVGDP